MDVTAGSQPDDSGPDDSASAFVAGATGYTGRAVVAELTRHGIRTVAHVRPDSPQLDEWRHRFETLGAATDTTVWSGPAMRETLEQVRPDMVFALLGTTRRRARAARQEGVVADYEAVDYGLTVMLLRATVEAAPAARFIYLSSMGVGPSARGEYLGVRWRLEQELRAGGLSWTIARPGLITGPDRPEPRPLERGAALATRGVLRIAEKLGGKHLRERWAPIDAAELATSLVAHARDPASAGAVVTSEELRTRKDG